MATLEKFPPPELKSNAIVEWIAIHWDLKKKKEWGKDHKSGEWGE